MTPYDAEIGSGLLDAIASFPITRTVTHCEAVIQLSPFVFYAACPVCGDRLKVRSFAAVPEVEDVFDAVFAWMNQPGAAEIARRRQQAIADDAD